MNTQKKNNWYFNAYLLQDGFVYQSNYGWKKSGIGWSIWEIFSVLPKFKAILLMIGLDSDIFHQSVNIRRTRTHRPFAVFWRNAKSYSCSSQLLAMSQERFDGLDRQAIELNYYFPMEKLLSIACGNLSGLNMEQSILKKQESLSCGYSLSTKSIKTRNRAEWLCRLILCATKARIKHTLALRVEWAVGIV